MSNKPKKLTWQEWESENYNSNEDYSSGLVKGKEAFEANEPYIDYLEAENQQLRDSYNQALSAKGIRKTVNKVKELEANNKDLKQKIKDGHGK